MVPSWEPPSRRLLLGVQRVPGSSSGMRSFSRRRAHLPVCCSHIRRESRSSLCASADPIRKTGTARSAPLFVCPETEKGVARVKPTLRQACSRPRPRAQFAFKDSMIHIICNSHYVSHFAAFFIDTGAKISVVESCLGFEGSAVSFEAGVRSASDLMRQGSVGVWSQPEPRESSALERASSLGRHRLTLPTGRS